MASDQSPPLPAVNASDISTQQLQSAQHTGGSSTSLEGDAEDHQDTGSAPRKSLFGPFPPSENPNPTDQQTTDPSGVNELSTALPPDRTESANGVRRLAGPPTLNHDPQPEEHASSIQSNPPLTPNNTSLPPLLREKTAPAIGPATDKPTPVPKESEIEGPVLFITLLLSSTGARHPYKLDEKYLKKRNVLVDGNNPINMSLYKLKELILRDWREEWEAKPSSPESIRLISMGKLLNDKARLSDSGFTNGTTPHIIHMTIKPQEIVDEEDAKMKAGGSGRGENERSPGCRCIIQ